MNLRLLTAAALLASLTGACTSPTVNATPFLASLGVSGDLAIADSSSAAVSTSFGQLGLSDDEASLGGIVRVGLAGAELSISGLTIGFDGEGTADGQYDIGGNTITAGTAVTSKLDLEMARALFTWDLVPISGVDLGIGLGASLIDVDLELQEIGGAGRIATDQLVPVPMLGARAAWTWGPVDLRADVGGLLVEFDGDSATIIDGELSAAVELLDIGDLVVGYRTMRIDVEYEDANSLVNTDIDLEGYYFGVKLGF